MKGLATRVGLVLLVAGCTEQTRLEVRDADGLDTLEVHVYRGGDACDVLREWQSLICEQECAFFEPPSDNRVGEPQIVRRVDGSLQVPAVRLPDEGTFGVVVVGKTSAGGPDEARYGCEIVETGTAGIITLVHPPCREDVCDTLYHPACGWTRDCAMLLGGFDLPCKATNADADGLVEVWEEAGTACPSEVGYAPESPCQPARVLCTLDASEHGFRPLADGVCPDLAGDECAALESLGGTRPNPAADLDCDGGHPLCESTGLECRVTCEPGDATCVAPGQSHCPDPPGDCVLLCRDDGTFGECGDVLTSEICDGLDNDCDGSIDEESLRAQLDGGAPDWSNPVLLGCNPHVALGDVDALPIAFCADGTCQCEDGAVCPHRTLCCVDGAGAGSCVEHLTDNANCGGCGITCTDGEVCSEGSCITSVPVEPVECFAVSDCNEGLRDPRSDACRSNICACGETVGCVGGSERCCAPKDADATGGECVDILHDRAHCGGCGLECSSGMVCRSGVCVRSAG